MNTDALVEEIHQIRARLLAECDGDLNRLLDRYQRSESRDHTVTLQEVRQRKAAREFAWSGENSISRT